jgi:hypothetical protein
MQLGFDLRFQVANPNKIPLPLAEILTALSIFPGATTRTWAPSACACASRAMPIASAAPISAAARMPRETSRV